MLRSLAVRCSLRRGLHTTKPVRINPQSVEEIKIPVPWGHIAGKQWGSKGAVPILAIHGWQDNAGTFDPLLEYLPEEYNVIALDLPGNGHSSHLPPFMPYSLFQSPLFGKIVKEYLNVDKFHMIGHSGGSTFSFLYSCIFPDDVISYCGIDFLTFVKEKPASYVKQYSNAIDRFIKMALRTPEKSPSYTKEQAKDLWIQATRGSLNENSAEVLLKRGANVLPDGKVVFSRDHRVKANLSIIMDFEQMKNITSEFKTNTCLIRGKSSHFFFGRQTKEITSILNILKNKSNVFEFHEIPGKHHLHMDHPKEIAQIYCSFLKKVAQIK